MNIQETQELQYNDELKQVSEINNMDQYKNLISSMKHTKTSNFTHRPSVNKIDTLRDQKIAKSFKGKFDVVTQSGEHHLPSENSTATNN